MVFRLSNLAKSRIFWLIVFVICMVLEGGALFFQHVLGLNEDGEKVFYQPCELCIYIRVWLFSIALFALIAMALAQFTWPRRIILFIQSALVLGLSNEVINLFKVEYHLGNGGSCRFKANFYEWAPLDQWFPSIFQVNDMCQATPKVFGPISMLHGLSLVSVCLIVCLAISGWQELKKR